MYLHTVHYMMFIQIIESNKMTLKLPVTLEKENLNLQYWKKQSRFYRFCSQEVSQTKAPIFP